MLLRSQQLRPTPAATAAVGAHRPSPLPFPNVARRPLISAACAPVTPPSMAQPIDEGDWERITGHLSEYESLREGLVKQARDVQKRCKQATFFLHQDGMERAQAQLTEAEAGIKAAAPTLLRFPALRQGAFAFAVEEYVEAYVFRVFLQEGRLATSSELPLAEPEEYLSGVLDFTEELSRHAIQRATVRDTPAVQRCRDIVDAIMGQFMQFDLRNSALRRKYDGLKYTLKKLENTMYELSLADVATSAGQQRPE